PGTRRGPWSAPPRPRWPAAREAGWATAAQRVLRPRRAAGAAAARAGNPRPPWPISPLGRPAHNNTGSTCIEQVDRPWTPGLLTGHHCAGCALVAQAATPDEPRHTYFSPAR